LKGIFGPTLVRRVFFAQLIACLVVWAGLMGLILSVTLSTERTSDEATGLASYVAKGLENIGTEAEARAFLLGAVGETQRDSYNWRNFRATRYQLRDATGKLVLSNLPDGQVLDGKPTGMAEPHAVKRHFLVARRDNARWSVQIALPMHTLSGVLHDEWLSLALDILIAFPLVFIPVWIAVARGLRPLKQLSDRIAERGADELAPIGVDPKYAEMKPLVTALDALMLQLKEKVSREQAFVQDAAHELRTPLAVIAAQAHVLCMARSDEERQEAERQMDRAIGRAGHLVHQLLDLARLDAAPAQAAASVDVAQLARQELGERVQAARARGLDLSLEAPDSLPWVLEPQVFRSVMNNLVDNALRYVQEGGRIVVELAARDGGLVLAVADNGPGIAEAEQGLVFERFYRGSANEVAGSGLGLAIARQGAGRMGGTVTLLPGLDGRGCRFVLAV
jgi:signal transduction histidine kinase